MEDKTLISCLTKSTRCLTLLTEAAALALALPCVPPTHANVQHALSYTTDMRGGKEAEDSVLITQQM